MLNPNGVIAAYSSDAVPEPVLPFWPLVLLDATVRFVLVYTMSKGAHAEAIAGTTEAIRSGRLIHNIGTVLPLDRIAEAHEIVESGRGGGKVVVRID